LTFCGVGEAIISTPVYEQCSHIFEFDDKV
jgi:hypothetical protein